MRVAQEDYIDNHSQVKSAEEIRIRGIWFGVVAAALSIIALLQAYRHVSSGGAIETDDVAPNSLVLGAVFLISIGLIESGRILRERRAQKANLEFLGESDNVQISLLYSTLAVIIHKITDVEKQPSSAASSEDSAANSPDWINELSLEEIERLANQLSDLLSTPDVVENDQ